MNLALPDTYHLLNSYYEVFEVITFVFELNQCGIGGLEWK